MIHSSTLKFFVTGGQPVCNQFWIFKSMGYSSILPFEFKNQFNEFIKFRWSLHKDFTLLLDSDLHHFVGHYFRVFGPDQSMWQWWWWDSSMSSYWLAGYDRNWNRWLGRSILLRGSVSSIPKYLHLHLSCAYRYLFDFICLKKRILIYWFFYFDSRLKVLSYNC